MALVTGNTFDVQLTNITSQPEQVQLFRQGYAPSMSYASATSRKVIYPIIWTKFIDKQSLTFTEPTQIDIIVTAIGGIVNSSGMITVGTTLSTAQARLNAGWSVPTPANPKVMLYLDSSDQFVVEIFDGPFVGSVGNICSIQTVIVGVPTTLNEIFALNSGRTATISPYTNVFLDPSDTPYKQLLAAQTGMPMNIIALDLDSETNIQFANPITYKRIDLNGNETQTVALSVIDPYQFQTKHIVNIPLSGLTFDGNCEFDYTISPFTTVKVTFRYVYVAESMLFAGAIQRQIFDQQLQAQQDMMSLSHGLKKTLLL
jgi:hypothetical protein